MSAKDFFIKSNSTLDDKDIWDVTPWQKDNISAITKSEVDEQDELSLEDFLDGDEGATAGAALSTQLNQLVTQNGIYTAVNNIGNAIKNEESESVRPEKTAKQADDEIGIKLQKIKNSKLKRVKLSSKFGLYNTYMNLLGNASGLFIGSLGKTAATQIADYALSKTRISDFALGLGTDSIRRIVKAAMDDVRNSGQFSSVDIPYDDIIDLNLVNFFTIYSSRPGLTVRSTNDLLQYVAGTDGKFDKLLNAVGNSISKTASNFGAKVDIGKFGNGNDKSKTKLVNLKQISEFANRYTFLIPETSNGEFTSLSLPDEEYDIKRGIIPQNFSFFENVSYKKQLERLAKKAKEFYDVDDEKNKKYSEEYNKLTDIKQQRKDYVKDTIIHSKARLNGGVETGSLKEYVKQRCDYLKELFPDLGIHYNENGNNIPTLMRQLNEKERSNGGLYIEPFYGVEDEKEGNGIKSFFIPFEFNPDVQENSASAKYTKDELLGRILPLRAYIGSEPGDLTITTKYIALEGDDETINDISTDRTKYWAFDWQHVFKWDLKKIQYLEGLYRSLTLPYIKEAKFVRPPIIRVIPPCKNDGMYLGNKSEGGRGTEFSVVSDLYSYPNYNESEDSKNNFEITRVFDSDENSYNHRVKRYVATSVQISVIDENGWGNNFAFNGAGACVRKGFKVTVTLAETTKNFLDTIPSFASYVSNELNETVLSYDLIRGQQQQGIIDYFNIERVITPQDNKISEESIKAAEAQMAIDQITENDFDFSVFEEETNNTENNAYTSSIDAEKIQNKNSQVDAISETKQQRAGKNIDLSSSGQVSNVAEILGISYIENGEIKTREVTLDTQKINISNIKEGSSENIKDTVGENKGLSLASDKKIDVTSMSFDAK